MSVVGFDLGNQSCVVAVARRRSIDVALNDESKRQTPALVCFGEKQRFLGTAGAATIMSNPKYAISQIKRLIGRPFSDPELQQDIKALPFSVVEGPDGFPWINVRYLGETKSFTPTQVMAMVFSDMKTIAEKNLNSAVADCCIGIPIYFTDLQRRAVMDAAIIAGLHPLRLMHETTATALAYGIYKTDLPENEQLNVAFVDVGHASMQVCIAGFKKGQLKVLAHSFDRCLGGRDFDEALFQHFAAKFKREYKIHVLQNATASLRLRAACEKLKKVLSAKPEATMNIECLMNDKDVRGFIKRDEFEQISIPIFERVKKPLEKALSEAQLTVDDIYAVEVVGSGSRVPAVINILTEFFGKEPRRTMNASECVSKGCALECAILSPTFKVRDFQVQESFPIPIALTWKGAAQDSQNQQSIVFPKGNPIPSVKALTFYRSGTFTVDMQYADVSELKAPPKISTYTIGPFQSTNNERSKMKVKVRLNLHGIVYVESAQMVTDAKVEATKEIVKKFNVPVSELVYGAMLHEDVQKAVEKEFEMALQDRIMEETKDKKNAVQAYVYDMRKKLLDNLHEFVTKPERDGFLAKLQETEDWLCEDGEDETKGVYIAKLEELKKGQLSERLNILNLRPGGTSINKSNHVQRTSPQLQTTAVSSSKVNVPKTVPQKSPGPVSCGPVLQTQSNKTVNPKPVQESDSALDPKLVEMINSVIVDRSPSVKWEDIAGLEKAKQTLLEMVILPTKRRDIFTGLRKPAKGLLLFGPPGTGKTMLAKAVASESQATFFSISASSLTSKWVGEGEKLVRTLFAVAASRQPSVIFMDEIDSVMSARTSNDHGASRRLKSEFLVQFDGVSSNSDDLVIVIGATNKPQELDDAVLRRLVKKIYIPLPDANVRRDLLKHKLKGQAFSLPSEELEKLVTDTEGYSGSDLQALCEEAAMMPIRELGPKILTVDANQVRRLNYGDFQKATSVIRPSYVKSKWGELEQWNKEFGAN